jgi:hypothetical protein
LETLSNSYLAELKKPCTGQFTSDPTPVETLPRVTLRTAMVSCTQAEGKINVAILFYRGPDNNLTVFFHEASDTDKETAVKARDGLAAVIRKLGSDQPPAQGQGQGQQAPKTN